MPWTRVLPGVWLYPDSCNVYAIEAPEGTVIIDAGTGAWLREISDLPSRPVALLCTHYFRDHSAGAAAAAEAGIPVYVPEYERAIFADPVQHFRQRETYIIYDNLWDLFAPITPTSVAGVLRDYERKPLAGMEFEVLPLPGVTISQIGLGVALPDGRRVAFCAEAIHSPGKLARVAPLQYNYNDLAGALQCAVSVRTLHDWNPDALLPSLGIPMLSEPAAALDALAANLGNLAAPRPWLADQIKNLDSEPLQRITDHVWLDRRSVANTWYVLSDSGKAMAIDYGYDLSTCSGWSGYSKPERRRALLHGCNALRSQFGIEKIDVVLVSHFHDDHVAGIPVLQRLQGTECWAADCFADLLADPAGHCFPCNWPVPARIDRRLPIDQPFTWEEYTFTLHPMSGHTRFAALIGFEADGKRFAHTGDQYFFEWDGKSGFDVVKWRSQNHVYRNGALLDGYDVSGAWMLNWRPDIVLQGHQPAMFTDDAFFRHISAWPGDYAETHRTIMPLGEDEAHFNLDSWGGWIWPYRTLLAEAAPVKVRVTVRNPLPERATLTVELVGPVGWIGETAEVEADARAEATVEMAITPSGPCRRQPFAAQLCANGKSYGQVAEALVTVGSEEF